jgi:hypothetical protein
MNKPLPERLDDRATRVFPILKPLIRPLSFRGVRYEESPCVSMYFALRKPTILKYVTGKKFFYTASAGASGRISCLRYQRRQARRSSRCRRCTRSRQGGRLPSSTTLGCSWWRRPGRVTRRPGGSRPRRSPHCCPRPSPTAAFRTVTFQLHFSEYHSYTLPPNHSYSIHRQK